MERVRRGENPPAGRLAPLPPTAETNLALELHRRVGNAAFARLLGAQRAPDEGAPGDGAAGATTEARPAADTPGTGTDASTQAPSVPEDQPLLKPGSTGEAVVTAQELLNAGGADPPLVTDGIFGPLTRAATAAFQRARGFVPDGVIGPVTWGGLGDLLGGDLPEPAAFSFGDTGDEVGLIEQRLNATGMAQPPLPIDATYDVEVMLAVLRFQFEVMGTLPTGVVDQATWDALEAAAPGGGTDAGGHEEHVESGEADALGEQVAGTSLHRVVGPGGLLTGPAVEEFQQKLNVVREASGQPPIVEDGVWGTETSTATSAYQAAEGISPATGVGDLETWEHLDADAPVTTVGYADRQWLQEQGGLETGLTGGSASRYSWRIGDDHVQVTVKVDFRNNPPPGAWFGFVTSTWNRYKAVSQDGDEVDIDFEMVAGSGGDACVVDVKAGTGRANAGEWFLGDTDAANTIPHEYGHLIGLRDEYQVHPGDYREITGREPPVGEAEGPADGTTPEQVAEDLEDAMVAHDDQAAFDATVGRGVRMGAWAQQVVGAYQARPAVTVPAKPPPNPIAAYTTTTDVAKDLFRTLPGTAQQYETIQVLTYSTGSVMGDPSRVQDPHDHGVQPRHVQQFCDLVAAARGGSWRVEAR